MTVLSCNEEVSSLIDVLPDELLIQIFKYLPMDTLILCEDVCLRWCQLATDSALWRRIVVTYSAKPGQGDVNKKSLETILDHGKHIYCLKIQYVYEYLLIKTLIENCKKLISLELVMCRIRKEFADDILKWPNLKKISLKNSILLVSHADLLLNFSHFKNLNYLALSDFGLSPKNCYTLLQCHYLNHIFIEKIKNLQFDFLKELIMSRQSILETLHIYGGNSINDSVLELLSQCTHLKDLAIIRCENLTDDGFILLKSLSKIEHLQIWNNTHFSEQALLSTLSSPTLLKLKSLSLSRIKNITSVIVDLISEHFINLKFLALYQCPKIINTDYERQLKSKFRNIDVVLF